MVSSVEDLSESKLGIYLISNNITIYNDEIIIYDDYMYPFDFTHINIDDNIKKLKIFCQQSITLNTERRFVSENYVLSTLEAYNRKLKIEKILSHTCL